MIYEIFFLAYQWMGTFVMVMVFWMMVYIIGVDIKGFLRLAVRKNNRSLTPIQKKDFAQ